MRSVSPWQGYDKMAAAGECGAPRIEGGQLVLSRDAEQEAAFFRSALIGRRAVLDLGCGPGMPLLSLAGAVDQIYGLDASPTMLSLARRGLGLLGLRNVSLLRGLAEALPFAPASFDGVALSGTLCSVPDAAPVLAEVARVCAPGAAVAVVVWEFGRVLAGSGPVADRSLRREGDALALHVTRYLSDPYRVSHGRYLLDTSGPFARRLLADVVLPAGGRCATQLAAEDLPPTAIAEATHQEEMQFDPATLKETFCRGGFSTVALRVAMSFDTPHIFARFAKS